MLCVGGNHGFYYECRRWDMRACAELVRRFVRIVCYRVGADAYLRCSAASRLWELHLGASCAAHWQLANVRAPVIVSNPLASGTLFAAWRGKVSESELCGELGNGT